MVQGPRRMLWIALALAVVWAGALLLFGGRSGSYVPVPPSPKALAARAFKGDDRSRTIAIARLTELAQTHGEEAIPVLCRVLEHDPKPFFRARAAESLGRIGDRKVLPVLRKALRDRAETAYSAVCWAIGKLGDPRGVAALKPYLMQDDDPYRALEAALALRNIPGSESEDLLLKRLVDYPISVVSLRVAYAIGCVGTERSLPALQAFRATLPKHPVIHDVARPTPPMLRDDLARALDEAIEKIKRRAGSEGESSE